MAISQKLALRQTTALIMTPQLQQAIKLLQLSNQELDVFIESEVAENPFLERESPEGGLEQDTENPQQARSNDDNGFDEELGSPPGEGPAEAGEIGSVADAGQETGTSPETDMPTADAVAATDAPPGDPGQDLDSDFDNVWTNDDRGDLDDTPPTQFADWGGGGRFDGSAFAIEDNLSREVSLRDHLSSQINMLFTDPRRRMMAGVFIDYLDDAGYLRADLEEIAEKLGISTGEAEEVLIRAQECDPPGMFARNLGECLALQLSDRDRLDPAMEILVNNLDRLGRREAAALKRICGVDDEDFAQMVAEIRALDPKPGLAFIHDTAQTIIPDIIVTAKRGGDWHLELNADTLPRVLVNQTYLAEISTSARTKDEREYIGERMQSANWLIKAMDQRATTILKVATEIVRTQTLFLAKGVRYLKPLTLRTVADEIGMHESTVSRVTSNKFMATPRGVFELKYFFTTAIASTVGGDAHSAESVRQRIKALINDESPRAVLSDDSIVELLSGDQIDIARRTVVKYRQAMGIPSSVQRRREKAMSL